MKISVITNETIAGTPAAVRKLHTQAKHLGIEILDPVSPEKPDFYLVLGGDGSVLRALHTVSNSGIPLVNINIGSLGYLTCAGLDDLEKVLESLIQKKFTTIKRSMLEAKCIDSAGKPLRPPCYALNDMVVLHGDSGRIIGIDLVVDGTDVTQFLCDGLIVATPTGSTAYSLSAGGPIVLPDAHALTVNTICPHTLTSRPLVLSDTSEIILRISRCWSPLSLSFDGQIATMLNIGDCVVIRKAKRKAVLVMLPGYNPFTTLSLKLGWSGTLLN